MGSRKILVIDDDKLVRNSIENVLTREGYDPVLVEDAQGALDKLRQESFDLIISDIRMPGMNGVEAIREIRRLFNQNAWEGIPIIFITGYAEMSLELNAEELGEVILKPFDTARLIRSIRDHL